MTRRFSVGCLMFWQNDGFMVWRETKVAIAWLAPCVLSSLLYARMPVSCPVSSSPAQATHWILVDQPNADMVVKTMKWLNSQLWIFSHDWVFQYSIFRDHGSYNHVILGSEMSKSVAALGCLMFYVLVESWAGGHRPLCCLLTPVQATLPTLTTFSSARADHGLACVPVSTHGPEPPLQSADMDSRGPTKKGSDT